MESTLEIANMWTISEARVLINALQPHAKELGFHVCLGGGVLNAGQSKKDLDLYFLPLDNGKVEASAAKLMMFLEETWGKSKPMFWHKPSLSDQITFRLDPQGRRHVVEEKPDYPQEKNSVYSVKRKFTYSGLRVDVFILGGGTVPQTAQVEEPVAVDIEATPGLINPDMIYHLERDPAGTVLATNPQPAGDTFRYENITSLWGTSPLVNFDETPTLIPAEYYRRYLAGDAAAPRTGG